MARPTHLSTFLICRIRIQHRKHASGSIRLSVQTDKRNTATCMFSLTDNRKMTCSILSKSQNSMPFLYWIILGRFTRPRRCLQFQLVNRLNQAGTEPHANCGLVSELK